MSAATQPPDGAGVDQLFYMKGGIGDLLQHLPFVLAHKPRPPRYVVASHQAGATRLFEHVGVALERFFLYADDEQLAKAEDEIVRMGPVVPCPRVQYFSESPFVRPPDVFADGSLPIVGVQLGGSRYSIVKQAQAGLTSKALPGALLGHLVPKPINILLFGSADEIAATGLVETARLKFICFPDIVTSLSNVLLCRAVVASDSVVKTMSAMLRIPTVVWLANYRDDFRDRLFIRPYAADGVMSVFRYVNLAAISEFDRGVEFTDAALRKSIGVA